jgi:hypothetical protein
VSSLRVNQLVYNERTCVQVVVTDGEVMTRHILTLEDWSRVLAKPGMDAPITASEEVKVR